MEYTAHGRTPRTNMGAAAPTVVLADDHPIVRAGVRALLSDQADLSIVGEAATGLDVVSLVERLQPDMLIVDPAIPPLNGAEVIRQVHRCSPGTRIIVLSTQQAESEVVQALVDGASAYVLKAADTLDLVRAVQEVLSGHRYLSPPLSERAIDTYIQRVQTATPETGKVLTARECQVLQFAAEGYTNQEIAEKLSISPRTVEVHRAHLMHKLNLHNLPALIRYALKHGLIAQE